MLLTGIPWLLLALATGWASQDDPRSARVDALFADWDRPAEPGACVSVVLEGQVVHEAAYGEANLELGVPLEPESTFYTWPRCPSSSPPSPSPCWKPTEP